MKRRVHAPPVPGILWLFLILGVFLVCIDVAQIAYSAGEAATSETAIFHSETFRRAQVVALADLLQQKNQKLYRAKAEVYAGLIFEECEKQGIGHLQLAAQIIQESGLREDATGEAGEIGLMQILPWWLTRADALGLDPITERELYNPANNIRWGVAILARCLKNTDGDLYKALCFYNAGPKWERGKRYAEKVLRLRSMLEERMRKLIEKDLVG